jgi:hypothetical protein
MSWFDRSATVDGEGRASRSDDVTQIDASAMACRSRNDDAVETREAMLALVAAIADHRRRMACLVGGLDELFDDAAQGLTANLRASDDRLGDLSTHLERYLGETTFPDALPVAPTSLRIDPNGGHFQW